MKRFTSTLLALSMIVAMTTTAMAADIGTAGSTGSTEAVLTAKAITFSVTVPMQLPIEVDENGAVTVASNAKIINHSAGAVKVSNAVFTPITEWTAINFNKDMSAVKVGTKEIGFMLNECKTGADGVLVFDTTKFPSIAAKNDEVTNTDELAIVYNATVAAQRTALTSVKVADVVFTIGWDEII